MRPTPVCFAAWIAVSVSACGSSATTPTDDAGPDAARIEAGHRADREVEAARPDGGRRARDGGVDASDACTGGDTAATGDADTFPIAAHPPMPQVVYNGGRTLKAPVVTAVTFAGYDLRDEVEHLVATLGSLPYWPAVTSEYGIGPMTSAPSVELSESAPATIDMTQIPLWLERQLDGSHPEFGAPTRESVYAIFYPSSTTITDDALDDLVDAGSGDGGVTTFDSCHGFGGYHDSVRLRSGPYEGQEVAFAVIPECGTSSKELEYTTVAVSHELVEAVTDPIGTYAYTGWGGVDPAHVAWTAVSDAAELGDMCELAWNALLQPACYPFTIQRIWSNAAAKAGHDPCQPSTAGLFFTAAPVFEDTVTAPIWGASQPTLGALIPLGASKAIEVDLYSDGPVSPWTVSADDLSAIFGGGPYLTFAFDKTVGQNGDKLHMTITAVQTNPDFASEPFEVVSEGGGITHVWYGVVSQND